MHGENGLATSAIGKAHINAPIEASWTQQCGVEHVGAICSRQEDHTGVLLKTVHLRQELVEGLLPFIIAAADASPALTTDRIDLVNENDAGGLFLGLAEQIANPARTNTHEQLNKLRGSDGEERHTRLSCNRLGKESFPGTRRAHKQHAPRDLGAQADEGLGLLEKRDHLLKFKPRIVNAGNVLKTELKILLGFQARLTAPKPKSSVRHLSRTLQQKRQADHHQQHQHQGSRQFSSCLFAAYVNDRQRRAGTLSSPKDLVVVGENGNGDPPAIVVLDSYLPLTGHKIQLFDLFRIDVLQQGGVTHRVLLRPKTLNRRRLSLLRGRGNTGVRTWCHVNAALHGA